MYLAANWYLFQEFQYSNGYIQIIGFKTVSCITILLLSVADEIILIQVSLSQVRRLNAAICQRYHLSEDIALLMYTRMILKHSDQFCWAWIVVQKCKISDENKHKSKDHFPKQQ